MRKTILALIFAALATASFGQGDSTDFIPDYGIEVMEDTITYSDGTVVINTVTTQPPRFLPNYVVFYFNIERFNMTDSVQMKTLKNQEGVLRQKELNYELQGNKIHEWLDMLYEPRTGNPSDTTIIQVVGKKTYNRLIKGEQ